ncbi:hypothetical protein ACQ4PT_036245 [Festuca glaucescens]
MGEDTQKLMPAILRIQTLADDGLEPIYVVSSFLNYITAPLMSRSHPAGEYEYPPPVLPLPLDPEVDEIVPRMPICNEWGIDPKWDRSTRHCQDGAIDAPSARGSGAGGSGTEGRSAGGSGTGGSAAPAGSTAPRHRFQRSAPTRPDPKGKGPLAPTVPLLTPSDDDEDLVDTIPLAARARRAGTPPRPAPSAPKPAGPMPPSQGRPTPAPASGRAPRATPPASSASCPSHGEPHRGIEVGGAGTNPPVFLRPASFSVSLGPSGRVATKRSREGASGSPPKKQVCQASSASVRRPSGGVKISSPTCTSVPRATRQRVIVESGSDTDMEAEAPQRPGGGGNANPELRLPTPGASRIVPPIVRVVEDEGRAGGPSEVILHRSARYPEGLFVDPGVYSVAHDVLGRVEQQQQSYAEAARRTAARLQRHEEFIAQQRREFDEACMDLSRARQQAQGAFATSSGASAEHWQKLLEDECCSRQREIALLEGERVTREDALNGQIGSLEDCL